MSPIYVYRPQVGAEQISLVTVDQGARATYVSTGLLPIRLQAPPDGHVDLRTDRSARLCPPTPTSAAATP